MPVPTSFSDLSTTAGSNSPAGGDNVLPDLDNYLRIAFAMLGSIYANTSTNGWTSPYMSASGALTWNDAGAAVDARFEGDTDANLLFLDGSADKVGIGTDTPTSKLHVEEAGSSAAMIIGASATRYGFLQWENSEGAFRIGTDGSFPLRFDTGANERMRIDESGNFIHAVTGTAPTLGTNSTMSFELTSNTSLKIVVRGSDGVTRSVSLTLA